MRKRWIQQGFEEKAAALRASARDVRVEQLRNVGNPGGTRIIRSNKDKTNCPKRQRKTRSWQKEIDRS